MDDGKRQRANDRADGGPTAIVTESSDATTVAPSHRVLSAVSAELDVDVLELPPLYDVVDPDALDALFTDRSPDAADRSGEVTFEYAACTVVVCADGLVTVL